MGGAKLPPQGISTPSLAERVGVAEVGSCTGMGQGSGLDGHTLFFGGLPGRKQQSPGRVPGLSVGVELLADDVDVAEVDVGLLFVGAESHRAVGIFIDAEVRVDRVPAVRMGGSER